MCSATKHRIGLALLATLILSTARAQTADAGAVPVMGLDLTQNMHGYLAIFDELMTLDFDVMVPGHHSRPADHEDVRLVRDYVNDVFHTMQHVLAEDHRALAKEAIAKYGADDSFAVGSVVLSQEENECARQIADRWRSRLDDVDVEAASHCHAAMVYAQWDVGTR